MPPPLSGLAINDLVAIAKRAGVAIMDIYKTDFAVETKDDNSPVTLADKAADSLILAALKDEIRTPFPIVTEETFQEGETTVDAAQPFWLIDPLDGTKQFVAKRGEFTVNIALIVKGAPVLGVVHAPAIDATYWGSPDGAFAEHGGMVRAISVRPVPEDGLAAVVSRSHKTPETDAFLEHFTVTEEVSSGSSIKFCRIAEGAADIYPRFGRTMEWDTAAGHAVVTHAGGVVLKPGGTPLDYGKTGLDNPNFVVCSEALKEQVGAVFS